MISAARARLPGLQFEVADIVEWTYGLAGQPDDVDLIFANAVLHWVPDHARLFPALVAKLRPGGCLAVQVPDNLDEPAQVLMRQVAHEGPWRQRLDGAELARMHIESPDWYYRLLQASCSRVDVWRTTYHHPLAGAGAIVEWFKGTGLLPYLAPLDAADRADYLRNYTQAIERAYPAATADGAVLLPFPRLFIVARRH
jgi:trans-aconitate 2-methyltransferase